jgi:hypothetical protein
MSAIHLTIDRITVELQQADDGQPVIADALHNLLIAEVRRALAEVAAQRARVVGASTYRMDAAALDVRVDDPADLVQMVRALAQRIAWIAAQAVESKGS